MKKTARNCLIFLLISLLSLTGCTMRSASIAEGEKAPDAAPSPEAVATPTPTPMPTPVPFDLVMGESRPNYLIPADQSQVKDTVELIAQRNGYDMWYQYPGWSFETDSGPAGLCGTRMDEPPAAGDIMAAEGNMLYILDGKDLLIVRLGTDGADLVSRTKVGKDWTVWEDTSGQSVNGSERIPTAVFCLGDRLTILYDYYIYASGSGELGYTEYTALDIFDVTDPAAPEKIAALGQDGVPAAAGLSAGAFYLITDWTREETAENSDPSAYLPSLYADDQAMALSAEKLLLLQDGLTDKCAVIGIYDLSSGLRTDAAAICGAEVDPYVGEGEILFYCSRIANGYSRSYDTPDKGSALEYAALACTDLYRYVFDAGSLRFDGVSTVSGIVSDSGCLDRHEGLLRCASVLDQRLKTDFGDGSHSVESFYCCNIVLLDENMQLVGAINDLTDASGECWVGYMGSKAVVTQAGKESYMADLSDPEDLTQIKKLSRPILAHAMRPIGSNGYTAFYRSEDQTLTLSLYNAEMEPLFERTFGSDHSSTLENRRGYFTDGDGKVIAFSADDSYCVYGYSPEKGFYLQGDVFLEDWAWNARGFCRNDVLYVVDTKEIFLYDLADFSCVSHIHF